MYASFFFLSKHHHIRIMRMYTVSGSYQYVLHGRKDNKICHKTMQNIAALGQSRLELENGHVISITYHIISMYF